MKSILSPLLSLLLFTGIAVAEQPATFRAISEVVDGWTAEQHLWVNGNLNVSAAKLNELESWLDQNGSNWTIVLMQSARGQSYNGRSGMTGVEFALGEGLSNQTGFADLVDARTGEKNGAVFVLFLNERKFSYFASDVFDKRSLGDKYWIGRLDKPAINAMRSGGRIVDAVKNTVSSIETSLTRKIKEEENRKRLAEIEKQRAIDEAQQYPAQLSALIKEAVERTAALRKKHSSLTGPIVRPDSGSWEAEVQTIARLAEQKDAQNARKHFSETQSEIRLFQSALDQWEKTPANLDSLEKQIAAHPSPTEAPEVAGHLARSSQALQSARANHAAGEPLYLDQVTESERALGQARRDFAQWTAAERQKQKFIRILSAIAALALLIFLIVSNRMRRPARDEAKQLLKTWQQNLSGKFDELFSLMDRTGLVVGSSADLDERGFSGTTEALARQTIRGVDELFIMSSATDEVMKEVETLVEPQSLFPRLLNTFSSRRYRKANSLLTSEPIGFDQRDHLEAILSPKTSGEKEAASRTLLGQAEDYEPFRISFEKLVAEYDSRQATARDGIGRLEGGIDGLPLTQQQLLTTLDTTSERAESLSRLGINDSLFPLMSLRQALLPASIQSLDEAAELGEKDPVEAFEKLIPESSRLVTEARVITETIESFRAVDLPVMHRSVARLAENERQTSWVDDALATLVARSEQLGTRACETSIAEDWAEFDDDLTKLKGRILSCEKLTARTNEEVSPLIETRTSEVVAARDELSKQLGIAGTKILSEPGLSPDEKLDLARLGVETALAAIDKGQAKAAHSDLAEVDACLDDASAMIALSRECAENHARMIGEQIADRDALLAEVAPTAALLTELQTGYASSVLLFSSRFGEAIEGQQSIVECIERANRRLDQSGTELEQSATAFQAGELIRAYGLLEAVANELGFARHQLALVTDQHEALREAEKENQKRAEKLQSRHREQGLLAEDRRTRQITIDAQHSTGEAIATFSSELGEPDTDPFVQLREGISRERELNALDDGIATDWKTHDLADSSATGAKAALTFCNTYIREARTDNIPDSRTLTRAIQRHGELTAELKLLEQNLETAHADWNDLFEKINNLTGEVAMVRGTLESELAFARDAAEKLRLATVAISQLHSWRSSYSVTTNRRAGSGKLLEAKQALALGNYVEARKAAIASQGAAIRERQRAKTKEAQKASAAAAAARRASFSSSSGSSFSSGSSGFSSSSFSSGSGFSRSGW